ncbi:Uncharacterized protein Rs2_04196 [Raphanus sativus]|nr:Uncharacterized protein Rs2_04196 [Raphanus sativus]
MAYRIGDALGSFEDFEITKTSARIRVLLEALEPLTMESVVDFSSGEEVPITLEYERIANFCSICNMMTHTSRYCRRNTRPMPVERNYPVGRRYSSQGDLPPRHEAEQRLAAAPPQQISNSGRGESFKQRVDRHGRPFGERITSEVSRVLPLKNKISPVITLMSRDKHPKQTSAYAAPVSKTKSSYQPQLQWRARERSPAFPDLPPPPPRGSPAMPVPPLERNLHESAFSKQQIIPSTEEVLSELRDVTLQYIHCADPTESAARRLRVIQGETDNLMATTASRIIAAATLASSQRDATPQPPAVIVLPQASFSDQGGAPSGSNSCLPPLQTGGKRRGRPPGQKKANVTSKCMGGSAKKRIFSKVQASPARQNATPSRAARGRGPLSPIISDQALAPAGTSQPTSSITQDVSVTVRKLRLWWIKSGRKMRT